MKSKITNSAIVRHHLRQLTTIRYIALGGQGVMLLIFSFVYPVDHLPIGLLGVIALIFTLLNTLTLWRIQQSRPISEGEFFGHLMLDILGLSILLYFSGGATNPFISYYLVPVSIAAATLRRVLSWSVTMLALLAYSALLVFYHPIPDLMPSLHHSGFSLHILGMWVNFIISAALITYFVFNMASQVREQEKQLAQQREEQLQDEQVLGVAALAAGAAHELGTPLNTMKLVIDDARINLSHSQPNQFDQDLITLQQQIERCRSALKKLVQAASLIDEADEVRSVQDYVASLLEKWRIIRPAAEIHTDIDSFSPNLKAYFHPTIEQALHNLLNNAADASSKIDVRVHWSRDTLFIGIRDYGSGIDLDTVENLGRPVRSDKTHGLGLGLFLSYSTLTRHGGTVKFSNVEETNTISGALTEVSLPLREKRL